MNSDLIELRPDMCDLEKIDQRILVFLKTTYQMSIIYGGII